MIRKYQYIGNDHILLPARCKYNDISDILACQWSHALIDLLGSLFISSKPDDGELCLNLTRINIDHTYPGRDEFMTQRLGEDLCSGLCGTVDCTTGVPCATCDRGDVDYGSCIAGFHRWENRLRHLMSAGIKLYLH